MHSLKCRSGDFVNRTNWLGVYALELAESIVIPSGV